MADAQGESICDYCGTVADDRSECNVLSCTFALCEDAIYHQDCLYAFLRSNKLEKNRKTGFKCPRGCGKGTRHPQPCPGRIVKSHPIIPRNDEKVKKRQAVVHELPPKPTKQDKAAEKAAAKAKAEEERAAKAREEAPKKSNTISIPINQPVPARMLAAAIGVKASKEKEKAPDHTLLAAAKEAALKELKVSYNSAANPPAARVSNAGSATSSAGGAGWSRVTAAAHEAPDELAPPPPPSLAHFFPITQTTRKGRAGTQSPMNLTAGGAAPTPTTAAAAAAAVATSPHPAAHEPLDTQSFQHFPPVQSLAGPPPPPPGSKHQAAASAWPTVAEAVAGTGSSTPLPTPRLQQQQQPIESSGPTWGNGGSSSIAMPQQAATEAGQASRLGRVSGAAPPATALSASQPSASDLGAAGAGQEEGEEEEVQATGKGLSKAQRKNLKRAERKKKAGSACLLDSDLTSDAASLHSEAEQTSSAVATTLPAPPAPTPAPVTVPPPAPAHVSARASREQQVAVPEHLLEHPTPSPSDVHTDSISGVASEDTSGDRLQQHHLQHQLDGPRDTMEDMCVDALVTRKCTHLFHQLQRLGFHGWQAVSAVRSCGCQPEPAVQWLIDHRQDSPAQLSAHAAALPLPMVDISFELYQMSRAKLLFKVPADTVYQAVISCSGDVQCAISALCQHLGQPDWTTPMAPLHQAHSLETFYTAQSELGSMSRAPTAQSELPWLLDESFNMEHQGSLQDPVRSNLLAQLSSNMGYSSAMGSFRGRQQLSDAWGGDVMTLGHAGAGYHTAQEDDPPSSNGHAPGAAGAWENGSSSWSGVYSRQGLNGSMGTWESHGSGDGRSRAHQSQADDEINSLMALMCR